MREIPLTKGYVAVVDDADFERVNAFRWRAHVNRRPDGSIKNVYAVKGIWVPTTQKVCSEYLHRFLLGITDPKVQVDHRDHDGLNNQRENIRVATGTQNQANARKRTGTSRFKGVYWHQREGKWRAQIRDSKGSRKHLGYFSNEMDAAKAYAAAAAHAFGEFAYMSLVD